MPNTSSAKLLRTKIKNAVLEFAQNTVKRNPRRKEGVWDEGKMKTVTKANTVEQVLIDLIRETMITNYRNLKTNELVEELVELHTHGPISKPLAKLGIFKLLDEFCEIVAQPWFEYEASPDQSEDEQVAAFINSLAY